MSVLDSQAGKAVISRYIFAKDYNRPHLMKQVFSPDAQLLMRVSSDSISFPPLTQGRDAIADILSRKFAATYDNVYTLCIDDSVRLDNHQLSCRWIVVMSHKEEQTCRLGYGSYQWDFSTNCDQTGLALVDKLCITIDAMSALATSAEEALFDWISQLPYPWCQRADLFIQPPKIAEIDQLQTCL